MESLAERLADFHLFIRHVFFAELLLTASESFLGATATRESLIFSLERISWRSRPIKMRKYNTYIVDFRLSFNRISFYIEIFHIKVVDLKKQNFIEINIFA